jgi:hypothetical protein
VVVKKEDLANLCERKWQKRFQNTIRSFKITISSDVNGIEENCPFGNIVLF